MKLKVSYCTIKSWLAVGKRKQYFLCNNYMWPKVVKTMLYIVKASALWADAFYKLICPSFCPCVRLSVCSLVRYRLNVFFPRLSEVGCPIFLEIWNPGGKSNGKKWSQI